MAAQSHCIDGADVRPVDPEQLFGLLVSALIEVMTKKQRKRARDILRVAQESTGDLEERSLVSRAMIIVGGA